MPSVSGWALRPVIQAMRSWGLEGFYALGIGLGFATYRNLHELQALGISFLCPRYRAGLCDEALLVYQHELVAPGFMPSVSGWALRPEVTVKHCRDRDGVSMPSVSGWALRHYEVRRRVLVAKFLCPRYRAGLCDALYFSIVDRPGGFYALGIGLGFATC